MQPTSHEIIKLLQAEGIVVGSFIQLGEAAKDIDVVIDEHRDYGSHPIFQKMRELYSDYIDSHSPGHMAVFSVPQTVEIFENDILTCDKAAGKAVLEYDELDANHGRIQAHGVEIKYWKQGKGESNA